MEATVNSNVLSPDLNELILEASSTGEEKLNAAPPCLVLILRTLSKPVELKGLDVLSLLSYVIFTSYHMTVSSWTVKDV